jgi:predicted transcriptional regulator
MLPSRRMAMYETAVPVLQGIGLLSVPLVGLLYSRIRQEQVLDNYTRGQVHGYILANPGEHYSGIRDALGLNNGCLAYHLRRLEGEHLVRSSSDGTHRRYYPAGMKVPEPPRDGLTEVQRLFVSAIMARPGVSQRELGQLMGLCPATVNFHLERLAARGVVRRERSGMRNRCFVNDVFPKNPPAPGGMAQVIGAAP